MRMNRDKRTLHHPWVLINSSGAWSLSSGSGSGCSFTSHGPVPVFGRMRVSLRFGPGWVTHINRPKKNEEQKHIHYKIY